MKIGNTIRFAAAALILVSVAACDAKKNNPVPNWPWPGDNGQQQNPDPEEWSDVSASFEGLPEHIQLLKSPKTLQGREAIAYAAVVDLNQATFQVWGINAPDLNGCKEPFQTPSEVYSAKNEPAIVINGGYFYYDSGKYYSSSLEVSNGQLLSPNINYASEDWKTIYAPTRGAFLEHSDGSYEVCWTFFKNASNHWIYQNPAENSYSAAPLRTPSATFPETGKKFEAVNGIGGGPVLLKNGEIRNTAQAELFDGASGIMVDSPHPRTAIGKTADGKLVLFVCEGRNMTEGVAGFTTLEVANILKDLGCTDALNRDGGGSTIRLVCGKEIIKPSDGKQRSVASCVYIR